MQTVEDKKVEIIARIQKALKQQRIVQAQIPVLKEVNTCKIFDKLHAEKIKDPKAEGLKFVDSI